MACQRKIMLVAPCPYPGDDYPRPPRRSHEFDAPPKLHVKPDPRPPLPCINGGCCACKPGPLPKKPMMANLKLRQLADCYGCRVSQECHNRRKTFYQRWQTYLDRLNPMPNKDYTVYCCDNAVDLGVNHDFFKYDRNLDLRKPPRRAALENFLFLKNVAEVNQEINQGYAQCAPYERWIKYHEDPQEDSIGMKIDKSMRLRFEPALTRWYELEMRPEPKGYITGSTIYKSRTSPFHKDDSFSTPIDDLTHFPTGNQSPFKELRDLKKNM